jgi:hypothetical protein
MESYWIAHSTEQSFISAITPEGVGQLLLIAENWAAGMYTIRVHRHSPSRAAQDARCWGHAVKDRDGNVLIEPTDDSR